MPSGATKVSLKDVSVIEVDKREDVTDLGDEERV